MTVEAHPIGPEMVLLPGVASYLRSVFELGRRSLRPALPALVFLFLYRLGMGAYGALTNYSHALGEGAPGVKAALNATPIVLLALVYIPFLPLQESILRGHPIHFPGAIRSVLRVSVNLVLSGIAQVCILLGPLTPITIVGARLSDPLGPVMWVGFAWLAVAAFFMIFTIPAVVLDGEGPLQSLRTSCRLVSRNFGSALGRLLVLAGLVFASFMVAWPVSTLGPTTVPIKLAVVTWTSATETLLYPFLVAAVTVLYRSVRPRSDEGTVRT